MVEQQARPRAVAPRVHKQKKIHIEVIQPVQVAQAAGVQTAEEELDQLKQYARKMSNSTKAEAIAFLKRAGIMDSRGNIKKEYCA
jgi:uncharacterized protein YihD (DUF1040 family)